MYSFPSDSVHYKFDEARERRRVEFGTRVIEIQLQKICLDQMIRMVYLDDGCQKNVLVQQFDAMAAESLPDSIAVQKFRLRAAGR